MDKKRLKARTIVKLSSELINLLEEDNNLLYISNLESLINFYKVEYSALNEIEQKQTVVHQLFGKKTTELSETEFKQYKAFLKRARSKNRKQS